MNTDKKILIKFATRTRTQKFFACMDNIQENIGYDNYEILIAVDLDDVTMNNPTVLERISKYKNASVAMGLSRNKVHAINRNVPKDGWDLLINQSDDQRWIEKSFGANIMKDMEETFPDGDGFLHYNDGKLRDLLPTMSIIGNAYYNRFGYIYHREYQSLWCDNEAHQVAMILGKHKYFDRIPFLHEHPAWNLAEMDEQYKHTESFYHIDGETFKRRKLINFEL